jgi:endoglucanase
MRFALRNRTFGNRDYTQHQNLMGNKAGDLLSQNQVYTEAWFLSEFGWGQSIPTTNEVTYMSLSESNDAEGKYWALIGSCYAREGRVDFDESFGV